MPQSERVKGVLEILASGFFFGFLGLFGKQAFAMGLSPFEFLSMRYLFAAAMTFCFVVFRSRDVRKIWLGSKMTSLSIMLGVLGYAVFSSFYFLALGRISASMTVILLYTYPVLVAIGGAIFFREHIPASRLPAIPMAFLGMVFLVWQDFQIGQPIGLIFGLCSALFYSVYILVSSHWLKGIDAMTSTFWIQLGAGLTLLFVGFQVPGRVAEVIATAWPLILMIAFVCSVLAMSLFLSGLLKVKSWEASLLSMAEPITGVAVGILFLNETLSGAQWVGVALVLAALALVSVPAKAGQ
ncbi:MAG: EamA family transporter [Deltaproteobacteria bacterium]|nr:EamA family transporter [Deltaproteobacteria bacterium]